MGKPRLPWKRGPAAWKIASNSEEIITRLHAERRNFFTLRKTAKLFGVSTQPVRDWIRLGRLKRDGPRRQSSRIELKRFIVDLKHRAEPFDPWNYVDRIELNRKVPSRPWRKLRWATFKWPKGVTELTPPRLAAFIGCHPSLIRKAIHAGEVEGYRRTRCRWAISRRAWRRAFYFSTELYI